MKKGVLGILVFLVSLCFVAQAFAFNAANRVTIAPNGEGDLLIFPAYFTGGGWESEVTLINTSQTASIVVHVAVREQVSSEEKDFFLFLSPTDLVRMTIKLNDQGVPVLETSDASLLVRNDCYNAADYAAEHGQPYQLELGNGWEAGYIVAVVVAQTAPGATTLAGVPLGVPPVDKKVICESYKSVIGTRLPATPAPGVTWVQPDNVLAGSIEIYNTQNNVTGAIRAFALKDYKNILAPDFGDDLEIGVKDATGAFIANNSQVEVDAVLANDKVVIPYIARDKGTTMFTATFPSHSGAYNKRKAESTAYDTEEHKSVFSPREEVGFTEMTTHVVAPDSAWAGPLERGWVLLDYDGTIAADAAADVANPTATTKSKVIIIDGVPAIHTVMHTVIDKGNFVGVGWFYAPSKMGEIYYDPDGETPTPASGNEVQVSHYAPVTLPVGLCPVPPTITAHPGEIYFCNY